MNIDYYNITVFGFCVYIAGGKSMKLLPAGVIKRYSTILQYLKSICHEKVGEEFFGSIIKDYFESILSRYYEH